MSRGDAGSRTAASVIEQGQGGSIPLCNVFRDTYPDAEIMLIGVEEPLSPDPRAERERRPPEIEGMALAEALFLENYAAKR